MLSCVRMEEDVLIVTNTISKKEIEEISKRRFGDMVKVVVDLARGVMVIGAELHADEEQILLDRASLQSDLWGINIYHALPREEWIEFDSMINIRPSQGNRTRSVEDEDIRKKIVALVNRMIIE